MSVQNESVRIKLKETFDKEEVINIARIYSSELFDTKFIVEQAVKSIAKLESIFFELLEDMDEENSLIDYGSSENIEIIGTAVFRLSIVEMVITKVFDENHAFMPTEIGICYKEPFDNITYRKRALMLIQKLGNLKNLLIGFVLYDDTKDHKEDVQNASAAIFDTVAILCSNNILDKLNTEPCDIDDAICDRLYGWLDCLKGIL